MIEIVSERIGNKIYEWNDKKHVSPAVMKFALISLFTNSLSIVLALLIGIMIGRTGEVALSLLAIATMRFLTGGYHFKKSLNCVIVSVGVSTIIPFIHINEITKVVLSIIAVILVVIYAPSRLRGVSRVSEQGLQIRKWIAVTLVIVNLFLSYEILTLAFFAQSLSLITKKSG
ncbi:accessory gene regulator B family protein [Paenibacillus sp. GCM10027626]|uniref:accessory gene regulator B family protein n=1 Tax=Paenibacillus sp. GCM10027626 TaxID=3273411 RepID=UPI003633BE33